MRKPKARDNAQLPLGEPVRNCGLFADHFLKDKLPARPEWQAVEGLSEAFDAIKGLFEERAVHLTRDTDEAPTEHDLIQPVLNVLWGHDCYQVQAGIQSADAWGRPDYAFFVSAEDRNAAEAHAKTPEYWRNVPCLGDAKRWSASLDGDGGAGRSPSAQIAWYLYGSGVRWGVLTNGRMWRLYEQDRSRAGGTFLEVDLESVIRRNDRDGFRWFYLFLRREAFVPDASGKTFLDKVFDGSVEYATEVGDRLKDSVYDALRSLMNGFCEWPSNQLDARDPETLRQVHENALIVLYRLLFVLFAEDRQLLPCEDEQYEGYSLRRLHREVNGRLREGHSYSDGTKGLWNDVCETARLIDVGLPATKETEPEAGGDHPGATSSQSSRRGRPALPGTTDPRPASMLVPAYNGGLFSPERHPQIAHTPQAGTERWDVGDGRLAEVIDLLAYERKQWDAPGTQDIDYGTLAVQHLGSIYEGLLELQPQVADEDKIETAEKGKPVFRAVSEVLHGKPGTATGFQRRKPVSVPGLRGQPPRQVRAGEVYLVTNRGERKATGSYYTPTYIVDYIVEHTAGPLADEAAEQTAEMAKRAEELDRQLKRANGKSKTIERAEWDDLQRRRLEPYLSLKILDPAMGSGHFLVGAADFLSLAMATDPSLPDLENGHEEPQAYYKRLVVERCLYGVDLNPLAVELAKLSLWLHTVSRDKALSFLDHHLRPGNSLIGARIEEDLSTEPPRFTAKGKRAKGDGPQLAFGFSEALMREHMEPMLTWLRGIMEGPSGTAEAEHNKEALYAGIERARAPFRAVANCWLAPYFGVTVTAAQYGQAIEALKVSVHRRDAGATNAQEESPEWKALAAEGWFQAAQRVAKKRSFFHWELEFPECFFGTKGLKAKDERGFEAVIGNPPYGAVLDDGGAAFARLTYQSAGGALDVFALCLERASALGHRGRRLGMIVPGGWLTSEQHGPIRHLMLGECPPERIVVLPYDVFPDAYVDTIIYVGRVRLGADGSCLVKRYGIREDLGGLRDDGQAFAVSEWRDSEGERITTQVAGATALILRHLEAASLSLGAVSTITRGITPFAPTEAAGAALGHYGSVARYDASFPDRRPTDYGPHLSEYRDIAVFRGPRVMVRRIISRSFRLVCTGAVEELLVNKSSLVVHASGDLHVWYLLALLNARVLSARFIWISEIARRDDYPQVDIATLGRFPIRMVDLGHPTETAEKSRLFSECRSASEVGDYETPLRCASDALGTHALLHGPGGRPEVREDLYWAEAIKTADPSFPGREDFVHDLLAMLAERMMDLNRQKHEAAREFLTWLEVYAGCEVDKLSNKTKLQAYWDHDGAALVDVLRANRQKLAKGDPTTAAFCNTFLREHEEAVGVLSPALEALEKTDGLIDQIVYKLYGLTDEEIAIVEETAGG